MNHESERSEAHFLQVRDGLIQVTSQIKAIQHLEAELEKKAQNNLALVSPLAQSTWFGNLLETRAQLFNRIQLDSDRAMIANGVAMQKLMEATREETKISRDLQMQAHELSKDMKRDSLSMKTVNSSPRNDLFITATNCASR